MCPPAAPREPGAAVGGGTPHFTLRWQLFGAPGAGAPKRLFPARLLATPAPPAHSSPPSPPSATLNSDGKHPCPLLAPLPPPRLPSFVAQAQTGRSSAKPRAPWRKCHAQCRCQIPCAPSPSPQFLISSPAPGTQRRPQPSRSPSVGIEDSPLNPLSPPPPPPPPALVYREREPIAPGKGGLQDPGKQGAHAQRLQELRSRELGEGGARGSQGPFDHQGVAETWSPVGPSNNSQRGPPQSRAREAGCPLQPLKPGGASSAGFGVRNVRWRRVLHTRLTQASGRASQLRTCFSRPSAPQTGRPSATSEPSVPQVGVRDSTSNPSKKSVPVRDSAPQRWGPGLRRHPHVWGLPGNSDCSRVLRCSREPFPIHRRGAI